jgi:hypothetical protein
MIVTHTSPDWDAIGAVWFLKRYGGLAEDEVVFVNTGNPDPEALEQATAVVDTGREYDPARLRFDHHQFPGRQANDDSAALMVYADVVNPQGMPWLEDIALLIFAGDTGKPDFGADWSRHIGIHALLSALKARRDLDDAALLNTGMWMLDLLAEHLKARYEARATLDRFTVYRSTDGLVRGLRGAPQGATFAAYEDGARLVVFTSESEETVAVGVMRGGESQEPDAGALVRGLLQDGECEAPWAPHWDSAEYREMVRWFLHPAGFFAGRGTAKAPDATPLTADFIAICRFIDTAWKR